MQLGLCFAVQAPGGASVTPRAGTVAPVCLDYRALRPSVREGSRLQLRSDLGGSAPPSLT